jgi:hypothetical protein
LIRRTTVALIAALALALLPAAGAASGGPSATKSGVLVNYVSTGKLRIAKRITILVVCSADCQITATTVIVAPGDKDKSVVAGPLSANVPGGPFFQPNGPLLKAMKAHPGDFKVRSTIAATNPATGASETISHTFRLKR